MEMLFGGNDVNVDQYTGESVRKVSILNLV